MITVLNIDIVGNENTTSKILFTFLFDNSNELPKDGIYQMADRVYVIAENSIAVNSKTKIIYKYKKSKWINTKAIYDLPIYPTNVITDDTDVVASNLLTGITDVDLNSESSGGSSIEFSDKYVIFGLMKTDSLDGHLYPDVDNVVGIVFSVGGVVEDFRRYKTSPDYTSQTDNALVIGNISKFNLHEYNATVGFCITFTAMADFDGIYLDNVKLPVQYQDFETFKEGDWYLAYVYNDNNIDIVDIYTIQSHAKYTSIGLVDM